MGGEDRLYPFQREGVQALVERPGLLLADDMGLGKTVQAATALTVLAGRGELRRALIVAPKSLLGQWRRALREWAPGLSAIRVDGDSDERAWRWRATKQVHLTSYETARNDIGAIRRLQWDVAVLDEAQRIKNRDTETSLALKRVPRARAWALTGTPLENRPDDLASILEFATPYSGEGPPQSIRPGPAMFERQRNTQLRRRKAEVLSDLPPKTETRVDLELLPSQRREYEGIEAAARGELARLGERASVMNVLEAITRLKQVCNFAPESGDSAKGDDVVERVSEIADQGHKALVFSQWANPPFGAERIAERLARFRPAVFRGSLSTEEREAAVERLEQDDECRALVLSLRAGGYGLNLQRASYVVHFDRWWNPAVEDQATDRAHRAGQQHPVTVYSYVCNETIEERIEALLAQKRALFRSLVDGVTMDVSRTLAPEELFGLFGLEAPRHLRTREQSASVPDRVRLMLEGAGWRVRSRPPDVRSVIDMKGSRVDELGRRCEVWLTLADGRPTEAAIEALAAAARDNGAPEAVLVGAELPDDDLRSLAERRGVELWTMPPASAA